MIHPKEKNVELSRLKSLRLGRLPKTGKCWKAIHHRELVTTLEEDLRSRGWHSKRPICVLSNNKTQMASSWEVEEVPGNDNRIIGSLGITNSTNQRERLWLFTGVWLYEEGIGVVLERISIAGRRTTRLDLAKTIHQAINRFAEVISEAELRIQKLKEHSLSTEQANVIIEQAGEARVLSDSRVLRLKRALSRSPTKWEVMIKFTKINQLAPPLKQMKNAHFFLKDILGD